MKTHINLQEYDRYDNPITYNIPTHGCNNGVFWDGQISATVSEMTAALQKKREQDNPKPLTLEQLQQMDGQPVWCTSYGWGLVDTVSHKKSRTAIVFSRGWKVAKHILPNGIFTSIPKG